MNSVEKVERFWDEHGAAMAGSESAAAFAWPMLQQRLGTDAAELDNELWKLAAVFVMLRSDDAAPPVMIDPNPLVMIDPNPVR